MRLEVMKVVRKVILDPADQLEILYQGRWIIVGPISSVLLKQVPPPFMLDNEWADVEIWIKPQKEAKS